MRVGAQLTRWAETIRLAGGNTVEQIVNDLYVAAYREGFGDGFEQGHGEGRGEALDECERREDEE